MQLARRPRPHRQVVVLSLRRLLEQDVVDEVLVLLLRVVLPLRLDQAVPVVDPLRRLREVPHPTGVEVVEHELATVLTELHPSADLLPLRPLQLRGRCRRLPAAAVRAVVRPPARRPRSVQAPTSHDRSAHLRRSPRALVRQLDPRPGVDVTQRDPGGLSLPGDPDDLGLRARHLERGVRDATLTGDPATDARHRLVLALDVQGVLRRVVHHPRRTHRRDVDRLGLQALDRLRRRLAQLPLGINRDRRDLAGLTGHHVHRTVDTHRQRSNPADRGERLARRRQARQVTNSLVRVEPSGPHLAGLRLDHGDGAAAHVDRRRLEDPQLGPRLLGRSRCRARRRLRRPRIDRHELVARRDPHDRRLVLEDVERGPLRDIGGDSRVELLDRLVDPSEPGLLGRGHPHATVVEVAAVDRLALGAHRHVPQTGHRQGDDRRGRDAAGASSRAGRLPSLCPGVHERWSSCCITLPVTRSRRP